jgi:hypothetical protein
MEIVFKLVYLPAFLLLVSCVPLQRISDVYVEDFQTEDINVCKPSDVDLSNYKVEKFFSKSRKVEYKIIHDHYNVAPCYLEGVLKVSGKACDWKIQASSIGSIKCNDEVNYYVCDSCEDLFN